MRVGGPSLKRKRRPVRIAALNLEGGEKDGKKRRQGSDQGGIVPMLLCKLLSISSNTVDFVRQHSLEQWRARKAGGGKAAETVSRAVDAQRSGPLFLILDIDFHSFQSPSDGGRLPFAVLGILTKRDDFTRGSLTRSSPPWIVRRGAGVSHVSRETRLNSP